VAGGDDRLLVLSRCSPWEVAERAELEVVGQRIAGPNSVTARVVVAHGSLLIGEGYEAIRTRSGGRVSVVAGGPRPARLREPLDSIRIEAGDQLHIHGPESDIAELVARTRLLEIDRLDPAPLDRMRGSLTLLIFTAAIAAAIMDLAPPAVAFLAAAAAVAIVRIIPAEEVYRSVDWSIIVLLAAMIPVGQAFESSGAADLVAASLADLLAGSPAFWSLAALCGATLLLSIFLNNVATAVIMGPLAIDLAGRIGLEPDAALLAVLVGASSDFLTPIGHQNNLLVMGPGGYRFTDYARVGGPLAVSTVLVTAGLLAFAFG
jgi:di/tricarboxylate transporter